MSPDKPSQTDDFDLYEVDGIKIYVLCTIKAKNNELHIKHVKVLFIEKLVVEGILT